MKILEIRKPGLFASFRKGIEVKLYEDTDEMPMQNYSDMNNYALQDLEIGNKMSDVDRHFNQLFVFLVNNQKNEALQKGKNLYQTFFNMVEKIDFEALQFGCFIHSIDGEEITDYSVSNIQRMIKHLSDNGLTRGMVRDIVESIKKNLMRS